MDSKKTMGYLILYTQQFEYLSSIYGTNVAKNINRLFKNGYLGSFPSPQLAAGHSTEIKIKIRFNLYAIFLEKRKNCNISNVT
jgi:hypothetical protein